MKPDELADYLLAYDPGGREGIDIDGSLSRGVRDPLLADMDRWASVLGLTLTISEARSFWHSDIVGEVRGDVLGLQTFCRMVAERLEDLKQRIAAGPGFTGWAIPCYAAAYVVWGAAEHKPMLWTAVVALALIWAVHICRASRESERPEASGA